MERFLRLSDLQDDFNTVTIAEDLLKLATSECSFLEYKPSVIAAAAMILGYKTSNESLKQNNILSDDDYETYWNAAIQTYSGICPDDLKPVILLFQDVIADKIT